MFRNAFAGFFLLCAVGAAFAQPVPESLKVPDSETLLLKAVGKGSQIYVCAAKPADPSAFAWTLDRPSANLLDESGKVIGKHYKGPTWESTDGSKITGQVVARAASPDPASVPWLLLKTASHEGAGAFARVSYIQRLNTAGGAPPDASTCGKAEAGKESAVDYQADYLFYAPRP